MKKIMQQKLQEAQKAKNEKALELLPNLPKGRYTRLGTGYELALLALISKGKVPTCYKHGSGKNTYILDHRSDTVEWLEANGHKYETGNDDPMGNKTGQWVKVVK